MLRKSLIAALACAFTLAVSPIPTTSAVSLMGPGTKVQTESVVDLVKGKKKVKKAKKSYKYVKKVKKGKKGKKGKKVASKAGKCGTYMYYNKKAKKCADARAKYLRML